MYTHTPKLAWVDQPLDQADAPGTRDSWFCYHDSQNMAGVPPWAPRSWKETTKAPGRIRLLTGWWFGTWFFHILGILIPIDFHIFQRGWNHQPAKNGEGVIQDSLMVFVVTKPMEFQQAAQEDWERPRDHIGEPVTVITVEAALNEGYLHGAHSTSSQRRTCWTMPTRAPWTLFSHIAHHY